MQLGPGWLVFINHTGRPADSETDDRDTRLSRQRRVTAELKRREDEDELLILLLATDEL